MNKARMYLSMIFMWFVSPLCGLYLGAKYLRPKAILSSIINGPYFTIPFVFIVIKFGWYVGTVSFVVSFFVFWHINLKMVINATQPNFKKGEELEHEKISNWIKIMSYKIALTKEDYDNFPKVDKDDSFKEDFPDTIKLTYIEADKMGGGFFKNDNVKVVGICKDENCLEKSLLLYCVCKKNGEFDFIDRIPLECIRKYKIL